MGTAVKITRTHHTAAALRDLAAKSNDAAQVGRLLAPALILEVRPWREAAEQERMDRQTLRNWVPRYRGVGAAIIVPMVNTEAKNEHLNEIGTQEAHGAQAVLVLDGAGWHQASGIRRVPDNITLLHLPLYIPELNPVENVSEYLRANKFCGLVWDTYDQIAEACRSAWEFLINDPDRIRSIGTRKWASVSG